MFEVPALPYAFDALEPHIDARTMEIHHDKHHAAYVNNLNKALEAHPDLQQKTVEDLLRGIAELPETVRTAVRNNGGGHANHSLFWQLMGPDGGGKPSGALAGAIDQELGGFETFQQKLNAAVQKHGALTFDLVGAEVLFRHAAMLGYEGSNLVFDRFAFPTSRHAFIVRRRAIDRRNAGRCSPTRRPPPRR